MTKTLKWLGGGIAAAMLLGLAGLFSGEVAEAQPSGPPHRFAGSVTLEGAPAAAGTSVTAVVGGTECGSSATVLTGANGSTYALDVPSDCAEDGDTVNFHVMGVAAAESGTWSSGARTDLDLTATTPEPEPEPEMPMDDCPDEGMNGMDDGMGDDGMDDGMSDDPPEPDEGNGMGDEDMSDDPPEPDEGDGMDGDGMADDCPTDDDGMDGDDTGMDDTDMDDTDMDDTDMDDTDMDDTDMDDTDMAPEVADTGTGLATSNTTSLAAILGVMALAITLGGYTFARRRR